jgi:hypothetical protein
MYSIVDTIPCLSYRGTTFVIRMITFPLLGELMMLCTYLSDCEYELSNTSRFGFQSTAA